MRGFPWIPYLPLAALLVTTAARADAIPAIEIFTDATRFPVMHAGTATVYDLSAPRRVEADLSRGLPKDPGAAAAVARARFAGAAGSLRSAYAGPAKALQYRLTKLPAVVFDRGAAVVYGVTDVAEAMRFYRRWKEGR
jgi:integrating conjugative element protein (TIGR03757 family)